MQIALLIIIEKAVNPLIKIYDRRLTFFFIILFWGMLGSKNGGWLVRNEVTQCIVTR